MAAAQKAMADGTTVITHNDDSSVADYPLKIVPAADWPEGAKRKIVANAHTREGGNVLGEMPQVKHTYRYFMSRYSFMNEKGVAIAESTFSIDTATEYGKKVKTVAPAGFRHDRIHQAGSMGGAVAALAHARDPRAKTLVLWNAVADGGEILKRLVTPQRVAARLARYSELRRAFEMGLARPLPHGLRRSARTQREQARPRQRR